MTSVPYYRSPLNYIGGKWKLLPQLLPLFPQKINVFVDLFTGGCNVGINATAKKFVCNDHIDRLIDLYNSFQTLDVQYVLDYIDAQIEKYRLSYVNEEGFLTFRRQYNIEKRPLDLFILAAFSFNHQIRFNSHFEFNTPFGRNRSRFNESMRSNLIEFLRVVKEKKIIFSCCDFRKFDFSELTTQDFVYCDPPYLITTGSYNDGKRGYGDWNEREEQDLIELLDRLNLQGVRFALSNVLKHKGKENRRLVAWLEKKEYQVEHITSNYRNSNYQLDKNDDSETLEVLITNYQPIKKEKFLF